ncbi:hypothetical protein ACHQM5_030405 [Ranunculus cassubicifolius]
MLKRKFFARNYEMAVLRRCRRKVANGQENGNNMHFLGSRKCRMIAAKEHENERSLGLRIFRMTAPPRKNKEGCIICPAPAQICRMKVAQGNDNEVPRPCLGLRRCTKKVAEGKENEVSKPRFGLRRCTKNVAEVKEKEVTKPRLGLRRCRKKVAKEENMPHLDKDVMTNIFSKIPVDILDNKFRYQCKEWFNILSGDPILNHSEDGILFIDSETSTNDGLKVLGLIELEGFELKIRELNTLRTDLVLISSCNGLVLASEGPLVFGPWSWCKPPTLYVLNPTTMESVRIPPCEHVSTSLWHELVFDASSKAFKVVDLCLSDSTHDCGFHIRSLDGCWSGSYCGIDKRISHPLVESVVDTYWNERIFVDGTLYMNSGSRSEVVSFDVHKETVCLLKLPVPENDDLAGRFKLTKLKGSLTLLYCNKKGKFPWDVWCLKDAEWEMKFRIDAVPTDVYSISVVRCYDIVGSLNDGQILVFATYKEGYHKRRYCDIFLYEVKTRQWRASCVQEDTDFFHCCRHVHANSLVSIK